MSEQFVKPELPTGWSRVPHGLWIADMPHGARNLLGWLWSHEQSYMARLTRRRISIEFGGGGQVVEWMRVLEAKGFISVTTDGRNSVTTLEAEPWLALAGKRGITETVQSGDRPHGNRASTSRIPNGNRTESVHREEQLEDQVEDHLPPVVEQHPRARVATASAHSANERVGFDEFWKLYPRKSGKRTAETAFARAVTRAKGTDQLMDGLAKRMAWWQRAHTPMDKIPHPATWLNGDRWLDQLEPTPATAAASMAQRAADVEAKVLDEAQQAIERGDRRTALKILRERARQQNQWAADHILQWIDVRSDSAIVASADETQRCTLEQVQEIRDYLVKLGMSHGGAEWNGSRQIGAAP